jgi:hypothetical protein
LRDTTQLELEAKTLRTRREVRDGQKEETALEDKQMIMTGKLVELAEEQPGGAKLQKMVAEWKKAADAAEDSGERRLMRRALRGISSLSGDQARAAFDQRDYPVAAKWYELSALLQEAPRPGTLFDLARAHAFSGEKKAALAALKRAVDAGFNERSRIESEPAFASLRTDRAFTDLLSEVRADRALPASGEEVP